MRFYKAVETIPDNGKEIKNMSDALSRLIDEGETRGEAKAAKLMGILVNLGRTNDITKAADDKTYLDKLLAEFSDQLTPQETV